MILIMVAMFILIFYTNFAGIITANEGIEGYQWPMEHGLRTGLKILKMPIMTRKKNLE